MEFALDERYVKTTLNQSLFSGIMALPAEPRSSFATPSPLAVNDLVLKTGMPRGMLQQMLRSLTLRDAPLPVRRLLARVRRPDASQVLARVFAERGHHHRYPAGFAPGDDGVVKSAYVMEAGGEEGYVTVAVSAYDVVKKSLFGRNDRLAVLRVRLIWRFHDRELHMQHLFVVGRDSLVRVTRKIKPVALA